MDQYMMRLLSELEIRFCAEIGVDVQLAAGVRIDQAMIERFDPVWIAGDGFSPRKNVLDQIQSIEIVGQARFANYVIKLCNAWGLAKALGVQHVIHPGLEFMPDECEVDGIHFSVQPQPELRRIVSTSYYHQTLQPLTSGPIEKTAAVKALAVAFTLNRPKSVDDPSDHLTVHIRSGDVFPASLPHPYYGQPPLAFYQYILSLEKWGKVTLVYETEDNPVIGNLREYLRGVKIPFIEQSSTLRDDLETLLKARNLVVARGTFAYPVVVASRMVEQVYCFENYHDDSFEKALWEFCLEGVEFKKVIDGRRIYRDSVLGRWDNSAEQQRLMIEYPVSGLVLEAPPVKSMALQAA